MLDLVQNPEDRFSHDTAHMFFSFFILQLEDDVIAKPGYISVMKTYADQQNSDDWLLLEFSALGFIGTV